MARAGAAGAAGHGTAGRRRFMAIASRYGAYNHLNIMLLGVLQLLYNMMAGASAGNDGRSGRRATTRLCFDGRGCRRADREPARARRTSEWHQGFMHCAYWLKLFEVVRASVVLCARAFR